MMTKSKTPPNKPSHSYCLNCHKIYDKDQAKYNQKTHSFECPRCKK